MPLLIKCGDATKLHRNTKYSLGDTFGLYLYLVQIYVKMVQSQKLDRTGFRRRERKKVAGERDTTLLGVE